MLEFLKFHKIINQQKSADKFFFSFLSELYSFLGLKNFGENLTESLSARNLKKCLS